MISIRTIFLFLIFTIFLVSCVDSKKTNNKIEDNVICYYSDSSTIKIYKEPDTFFKTNNINIETKTTNYIWKKHKIFSNPGWWYFYTLIKEKSIQKIKDSNYNMDGEIILEAISPNTNPVQDSFNFYKPDWTDTFIANKVEYTNEYIKLTSFRDDLNSVTSLVDYNSGKIQAKYSSKLIGIFNPNLSQSQDCITIGYLEQPNRQNQINTENNLCGQLTLFSPVTKQKIVLNILSDFDDASEWNYYKYLRFSEIKIIGNKVKNEIENESYDILSNMQFVDEKLYQDTENYKIILIFQGLKNMTLTIPVKNKKIDISKIISKDFTFEISYSE